MIKTVGVLRASNRADRQVSEVLREFGSVTGILYIEKLANRHGVTRRYLYQSSSWVETQDDDYDIRSGSNQEAQGVGEKASLLLISAIPSDLPHSSLLLGGAAASTASTAPASQ